MTMADVTEDLFEFFDGELGLSTIARVVRHCHRELEITRGAVSLALLERLSRERLSRLAGSGGPAARGSGMPPLPRRRNG